MRWRRLVSLLKWLLLDVLREVWGGTSLFFAIVGWATAGGGVA